MLCRAVTAAVAVTYVICVLLLSGIQKEDLDAGVLTKLQRHNVNIDDTNNEELLQMCTNEREKKNNNSVLTITESQTRVDCADNNINSNFNTYNGSDDLKRLLSSVGKDFFSTEHKSNHELQENDNKGFTKNRDENKVNFDKIIRDNDRLTEVESLLKYVKNFRINETTKRPDNPKEPDNKRSVTDSLHPPEEEALNKLLRNFILRRNNVTTAIFTTTQKTINIDDLFEKLYSLQIPDLSKKYNSNGELGRSFINSHTRRNAENSPKEKEIAKKSELTRGNSHISRKNLTDILSLLNQDADLIRNFNKRTEYRLKSARNPNLNNFVRLETVDTTSTTTSTNVETRNEISRNMIKEIADSVKEIVLRDLRQELHKTTVVSSSSTTTTTKSIIKIESSTKKESITQTTHKEENTKTKESVMNKFLELFEEIKSLRQNTIVLTSDNEKDINSKEIRPKELQVFSQVTTPLRKPNISQPFNGNQAYRINQYPAKNLGNFNLAPRLLNHKSNRTFITEKSKKLNKGLPPITIQTNNIEIPPLGIPLSEPQNIISQNIIVTTFTKAPYRIVSRTNNNDSNGIQFKNINLQVGNQYSISNKHLTYKSKQDNPRITKEPHTSRSHNFRTSNKDNVIRLTLNNNDKSDYYEKINIGKYYPNLNSDEKIKNHKIPRFHEQLEKAERYLDYPEEEKFADHAERYPDNTDPNEFEYNNERKIASRQQMSINNVKKKSYDDTHFKKFLQSQQKVTDMLERILGEKGNVHSVETA